MKSKKEQSPVKQNFIIQSIPNALTCWNIICGCLGIIQIFKGDLALASYFVFIGALFDFADGFAARILNAKSVIGKDLDSLADMVTFGVLPGFMAFYLLQQSSENELIPYLGLLIPVFSALRLAKFNNDSRQTTDFIGLPTPANALFFVSIPLIIIYDRTGLKPYFQHEYFMIGSIILFSFLLVSEIKLFSLKIKSLNFNDNQFVILLILGANILFYFLFFTALPFIIILYIILSIIKNYIKK